MSWLKGKRESNVEFPVGLSLDRYECMIVQRALELVMHEISQASLLVDRVCPDGATVPLWQENSRIECLYSRIRAHLRETDGDD